MRWKAQTAPELTNASRHTGHSTRSKNSRRHCETKGKHAHRAPPHPDRQIAHAAIKKTQSASGITQTEDTAPTGHPRRGTKWKTVIQVSQDNAWKQKLITWWELARAQLPEQKRQDKLLRGLHTNFSEDLTALTLTIPSHLRPAHILNDGKDPSTNRKMENTTNDTNDANMQSPPNHLDNDNEKTWAGARETLTGDITPQHTSQGAPATQRNLDHELNNMTPAEKSYSAIQALPNPTDQFPHASTTNEAAAPFALPSVTPQGKAQPKFGIQSQLTEATRMNADVFKSHFGDSKDIEDQQVIIQSQIVELLRREAVVEDRNTSRDNEILALKNRQANAENQLHKLDKLDVLQDQVVTNTGRLDQHNYALNNQARSIETILNNLEKMTLDSDEKHDLLLAEVRKGNEALETKTQAVNFPALNTQAPAQEETHTPSGPPNRRG